MNFQKLFLAGMVVFGIHMCGIGLKFPLIATHKGGKTSKSLQIHFVGQCRAQCKFS